jgi:chemotaxis protein methyltransferase CheR
MLLAEHRIPGVLFELTASDLCERRLEKAQSGLYSPFEVQRGLSAHRLVRHFENAQDGFVLSPRIRAMVRWRRANLLEDLSRFGCFDLVLCRNHLAALTDSARSRAMANLSAALAPGGILALAPGESAPGFIAAHGHASFHTRPGDSRAAA